MVDKEFAELKVAAQQFKAALWKFRKAYDPETVGIDEFVEHLDDVLFEIDQELQEEEEL